MKGSFLVSWICKTYHQHKCRTHKSNQMAKKSPSQNMFHHTNLWIVPPKNCQLHFGDIIFLLCWLNPTFATWPKPQAHHHPWRERFWANWAPDSWARFVRERIILGGQKCKTYSFCLEILRLPWWDMSVCPPNESHNRVFESGSYMCHSCSS